MDLENEKRIVAEAKNQLSKETRQRSCSETDAADYCSSVPPALLFLAHLRSWFSDG